MSLLAIPDIISFFLLCFASYLLWKERIKYRSLFPFAVAVALLSIGRITDVLLEQSLAKSAAAVGWKRETIDLVLSSLGDVSDALGVVSLILGFLQTIRHRREEEKRISNLERLLPLCAWCKKYRTAEGEWKPIEAYLRDTGAPQVTHGICPECALKAKNDFS